MAVRCDGNRNYTAPAKFCLSPNINPLYVCDFRKDEGGNFTNNLIKTNPLDSRFDLHVLHSCCSYIPTAVTIKHISCFHVMLFWVMGPCRLGGWCRRFGRNGCYLLDCRNGGMFFHNVGKNARRHSSEQRLPSKSKNAPLVVIISSPSLSQTFCSDMQCTHCTFQRKFTPVSAKLKVSSKISLHPCQATRRHIPEDMSLNL